MATIRDQIQEQLLERLRTLEDYTAERRYPAGNDANHKRLALLLAGDEQVLAGDTMTVQKEMAIEIMVQVRAADAPADLDRNPERYLDQELGRVEGVLFTPANLPGDIDLRPEGLAIVTDPGSDLMRGILKLSVVYRHNIGDPSTFNPGFAT